MDRKNKTAKFEIIDKTKTNSSAIDEFVFEKIKNAVLGEDYDLSLVIVEENEIRKINNNCRNIDKPTDILSFPLSDKEGEIFICPKEARREALNFDRSYDNFVKFLFIHGLVHLKGFDHSDKMESQEKKIRKIFGV